MINRKQEIGQVNYLSEVEKEKEILKNRKRNEVIERQ